MMLAGTVQYGWKLISLILEFTIGDGRVTIETHLLEGGRDLYGQRLRVAFVKWMRPELAFDGLEPLRAQIARDCDEATALFAAMSI